MLSQNTIGHEKKQDEWFLSSSICFGLDASMLNNRENVYKKAGPVKNLRKMQFINLKDVDKKFSQSSKDLLFQTSESLRSKNGEESVYDEYEDDFGSHQNTYSNENKIQLNILAEFETNYFIMKRMNQTDFLVFPAEYKEDPKVIYLLRRPC